MNYIGIWKFHSIGTFNDECETVYLGAEEYLKAPMPYIDEADPEAVADEMKERKQTVGSCLEVCEDGKLYMLMPLPEGVSQEEVDAAVAAGVINLRGGMLTDSPVNWEEREGALWAELGMSEDGFVNMSEDSGFLTIMTTRYEKVQ